MLRAHAIVKTYGAVVALDDVTLEVGAAECVALVGESGSGKTTLLRTFNRLVEPDAGDIHIDGHDLRTLDAISLRRRIGYVPQDGGLLPHWTVLRNAALVPWLRGLADAADLGRQALARVGLDVETFGARYPHQLSGGQRQRVAIARALAASPAIILLDEPFGALDAITRADVQTLFDEVRRERQVTAVLVTHDLHEALRLADRVVVMRAGQIEQAARPTDLLHAPATPYVEALLERSGLTRVTTP